MNPSKTRKNSSQALGQHLETSGHRTCSLAASRAVQLKPRSKIFTPRLGGWQLRTIWHETSPSLGTLRPFPGCAKAERRLRAFAPRAGMAFAGVPRSGPPAIPFRRARLASGRSCRRLSGGRLLDAVGLHHADPARGIPARHDLPAVGSGIRAGFRFFSTAWITRTSLWAVAKTACLWLFLVLRARKWLWNWQSLVREAACAHSTRTLRSAGLPFRARPLRRRPPLSLLPGQSPAHAAQCACEANMPMSGIVCR